MDGNTYALAKEAINRAYKLGIPVLNYCAQLEIQAEHQWDTISKLERNLRETEKRVAKEMAEIAARGSLRGSDWGPVEIEAEIENYMQLYKESKAK
jgi:isopentenyl diphosphate isomerase/L-lactate dehydrogenase-like FMN-dependent dehydrogenase